VKKKSTVKSFWLQLAVVLLPLLLCLSSLPTSYFEMGPGVAMGLEGMIKVEGKPPLEEEDFYLTSVMLEDLSPLRLLLSLTDREAERMSLREMVGEERSLSDYQRRSEILMELSKNAAIAVALREEGFSVVAEPVGAIILGIWREAPIARVAHIGDIIVAVEGMEVKSVEDLKRSLEGRREGEEVELEVLRGGEHLRLGTQVVVREEEEGPAPILGIYSRDYYRFEFPLQVDIEMEDISGPSAGLMMTLAIINVLEGGGLSGGTRVAGTGEIFPDGRVGPIGGVNFKIATAERAGAEIFLVPRENYEEISELPSTLQIYPVGNLQEALEVLRQVKEKRS
jgi:PDZ domain-containing protein